MVASSRTQLASQFHGYESIYAYLFIYDFTNKTPFIIQIAIFLVDPL